LPEPLTPMSTITMGRADPPCRRRSSDLILGLAPRLSG
jgi:hypothetical protein